MIKISQLKNNQVKDFYQLYKSLVLSDFKEWNNTSKNKWLKEDYSPSFWKNQIKVGVPVFIAQDNGRLVGYVAIEAINFGVVYLGWIGVLKEYRKTGVGKDLMLEVEKWGKGNNYHKIELETQIKELLPFFIKQGFVLEGIRKNSWQKLDNYMFGKSLL